MTGNQPEAENPKDVVEELEDQIHELESEVCDLLRQNNFAFDSLENQSPTVIGRFEILETLSRQGQALVYLAFDPVLQRKVVLKIYLQSITAAQRAKMVAEGRALAKIESPYVVKCLGVEEYQEIPFLVLQYVPGKTLTELVETDGLLKPDRALSIVRRLAEGLRHLHQLGLAHRDLKPSNVIIVDDTPVLVDFGLVARPAEIDQDDTSGTPAFMAPEQAREGQTDIDTRVDIYGLGAILHFLVAGHPPQQTVSHEKRPLETLLKKSLATNPVDRIGDVSQMIAEIDLVRSRFKRNRIMTVTGCVVLLLGVILGGAAVFQNFLKPNSDTPIVSDVTQKPKQDILRTDFGLQVEMIDDNGNPLNRDKKGVYQLLLDSNIRFKVTANRDCKIVIASLESAEFTTEINKCVQLFPRQGELADIQLVGKNTTVLPKNRSVRCNSLSPRNEYVILVAWTGKSKMETVIDKISSLIKQDSKFVQRADEIWRGLGDEESELGLTSSQLLVYFVSNGD